MKGKIVSLILSCLMAISLVLASCGTKSPTTTTPTTTPGSASPSNQYRTFNDGIVAFEYPSNWGPFPGEVVAQMKSQMGTELQIYKRHIVDLQMFLSPKEEASFFISKTRTDNPLSAQDLLAERQNADRDALKAGYLAQINTLATIESGAGPVIVEDVDRNDGQRARTVHIVVDSYIYEVTIAVSQKANYENYGFHLDHVVETFRKMK